MTSKNLFSVTLVVILSGMLMVGVAVHAARRGRRSENLGEDR